MVNEGHPYSLEIDGTEPVETFCVFFRSGLVSETLRDLITPEEGLLDNPAGPARPTRFLEAARRDEGVVLPELARLRRIVRDAGPDSLAAEQGMLSLAAALLRAQTDAERRMARLPGLRPSTREEVFRRLERGREFLASQLAGRPTLDRTAQEPCLSPYHFHCSFTSAFGETPHRHLTRLRLQRAHQLLERTDLSVTSVCQDSGFPSLGSFVTVFRKAFGLSPRRYRLARNSQD